MGEVSWRWTLRLSLAALPLAILCLQTPLPRLTRRTALPHYAHQIRNSILQWRCLGHMGITLCAFALLYGPMVTYFPLLAQTRFHVSPAAIGLLFALSSLGTALASSTLGWLNRRLHTRHMVLTGAGLFLLSMLSMLLVTRVWDAFWMCILPIMLYGLGQGLTYPAVMTSLSSLAPCEGRGAIMAVNGTVLRLAQSLSPVLCGLAFTGGAFTGVYILGAGMACVIAGLALLTFPSHRDRIP